MQPWACGRSVSGVHHLQEIGGIGVPKSVRLPHRIMFEGQEGRDGRGESQERQGKLFLGNVRQSPVRQGLMRLDCENEDWDAVWIP